MKLLILFTFLAVQYAIIKTWSGDSYSTETSPFGWIGYLRRLSLILLMLLGVILYYVPESRPHACKVCCVMIDLVANGLKSALNANEAGSSHGKIASGHVCMVENRPSSSWMVTEHRPWPRDEIVPRKRRSGKTKALANEEGLSSGWDVWESDSGHGKRGKSRRFYEPSGHRYRSTVINDTSMESHAKYSQPLFVRSKFPEEFHRYLKFYGNKATIENYAFLISDQPQMAMTDKSYEDDGVVILHDNYPKVQRKECVSSTDDTANCTRDEPTRDLDKSVLEACTCWAVESSAVLNLNNTIEPSWKKNELDCNRCNASDITDIVDTTTDNVASTIIKSRANSLDFTMSSEEDDYDVRHKSGQSNYDQELHQSPNVHKKKRKVNFEDQSLNELVPSKVSSEYEETANCTETMSGIGRRIKALNNDERIKAFRDIFVVNEDGEVNREYSNLHDLPEKDYDSRYHNSKIRDYDHGKKKPALFRIANWIFSGCPEMAKRQSE